jgi:hypothetical protein
VGGGRAGRVGTGCHLRGFVAVVVAVVVTPAAVANFILVFHQREVAVRSDDGIVKGCVAALGGCEVEMLLGLMVIRSMAFSLLKSESELIHTQQNQMAKVLTNRILDGLGGWQVERCSLDHAGSRWVQQKVRASESDDKHDKHVREWVKGGGKQRGLGEYSSGQGEGILSLL